LAADARDDAAVAVQAIRDGDLETVGNYLAAYRGDPAFAYYFALDTDPRSLGDALGTVATEFDGTEFDADGEPADATAREAQDEANKQNLLLLLANGRWPTAFLKTVTVAYTEFDKAEGEDAWPGPQDGGGLYAPAPSGVYLTDGIVALTAALTANPEASAWAFADFQPGTKEIEGSDYEVGNFTHYLLFQHT
jgi:hypothetical protein